MERTNKKASEEESGSAVGTSQIQDLETNIYGMIAESLNFWLTEFIMEVCKDTGETYLHERFLVSFLVYSVIYLIVIKECGQVYGQDG